jgi:molybdopterin synthase catalytic subunit
VIVRAEISDRPLRPAEYLDLVADPMSGATALFVGTVRDHDPEATGTVVRLDYTAHPDAPRLLGELAAEVDDPGMRIAIGHRIGSLQVGEVAIICAVSSAHRADAFEINRELVEAVKHRLPVWKRQIQADGAAGWVGLGTR